MRIRTVVAALAVVTLSACADPTSETTTTPPTAPATTTPEVTAPTSAAPTTTDTDSVCVSGDVPFVDSGTVARLGEGTGDAEQVAAVRWAAHPGCERIVVDLLTADAAPAGSIGESAVAVLDGNGVIRISLPQAVRTTGIVDSLFDGELAQRAFVVRLFDDSLAVDIHTATSVPVQARAFTVDAPARIVVDLVPAPTGGATVAAPPAVGDNIVVLSTPRGEVSYPIQISGYARTFEANVVGRLVVDETVAVETFTTATDWLEAWGSFTIEIPTGPTGPITLFIGEDDPRDGSPRGVSFDLIVP